MARQIRDSKLQSREARAKLAPRRIHWKQIWKGLKLGYRRNSRDAVWLVRIQIGPAKYEQRIIARVDDACEANGSAVLTFAEALLKAQAIFDETRNPEFSSTKLLTVREVLVDYAEWSSKTSKSASTTRYKLDRIIAAPDFQNVLARDLTAQRIERFHRSLVDSPSLRGHGRTGKTTENKRPPANSPDYADWERRRKATANSYLTLLKAALNRAYQRGLIKSRDAWDRVRPFKGVDKPRVRWLTITECQRLLNAAPAAFRKLVHAALLTGARYGELTSLRVEDVDVRAKVLVLRPENCKNGKQRAVHLTEEGVAFFDSVAAGRKRGELLFLKDNGEYWRRSEQGPHMRRACKKAEIVPAITFHILRHTYASLLVQRGVSLQVVAAALGHSDTRITERHYGHLSPSYTANAIRANLPTFIAEGQKVVSIAQATKSDWIIASRKKVRTAVTGQ